MSMSACTSLLAVASSTKAERALLPCTLDNNGFGSSNGGNDAADVDTSGASTRSANDAATFGAMMQLSAPRNLPQYAKVRTLVLWLTTSAILFLMNQLTTFPVGFFFTYSQ